MKYESISVAIAAAKRLASFTGDDQLVMPKGFQGYEILTYEFHYHCYPDDPFLYLVEPDGSVHMGDA